MLDATPLLRAYARFRGRTLARQSDPKYAAAVQERQLTQLLRYASNTRFGREHAFDSIKTIADFQREVPLQTYEQFWTNYLSKSFPTARDVFWPGLMPIYAASSGTTSGTTKWLPVSRQMLASNKRAGVDLLVHHVTNRPASKIMGGRSFMLGGTTELVQHAPGVFSGDLSGIAVKTLPLWARARYFPPAELALMKDWEKKIDILARESLTQDIRMISGVPSWALIFLGKAMEVSGKQSLPELYPNLEMLTHGGVNFSPYRAQFESLLAGSHAELREVYPASEGFIAVADRGPGDGLRLVIDHGIFFEFVPLEELQSPVPTRHWLGNVELGVNYALVMTTCAGLWSYVIGDTVRFVERSPFRLVVTGRTSYYLNAFGEHLVPEEIEDAVTFAANEIGSTIADYSVGAVYPKRAGELGGHLYVVEFATPPTRDRELQFLPKLDSRLKERNEDYTGHRAEGFGLNPPRAIVVPPGMFASWMKSRGKLGGQNKVPRIINDRALFEALVNFSNTAGGREIGATP